MKKVLSLFLACLMIAAMAVVPVSAASPKEDMVAAFKKAVPTDYVNMYLPMVENVLQQITVTREQADGVIECINACSGKITTDKGHTLHLYTLEERLFMLEQFKKACKILNLNYKVVPSSDSDHFHDFVYIIYDANGNRLGDFDGDIVRKTNVPYEVDGGVAVLAVVLLLGAGVAAVYGKKLLACR